jgi:hypothetical protein
MRRRSRSSLVALAFCWAPAAAFAAPLAFTGTLSLHIGVQVARLDLAGVADVSDASVVLPLGAGTTTAQLVPILPSVAETARPIVGLQFTARNGAGSFALDGAGRLGGAMPLLGFAKVCLFQTCPSAVANVSVPLDAIGAGGVATVQGVVNVTVAGAPWTTSGTVTGMQPGGPQTAMGFRRGPLGDPASFAQPGGSFQLVTPVFISTFIGVTPAFATTRIEFVPEPASFVLCVLGISALAARARRSCAAG